MKTHDAAEVKHLKSLVPFYDFDELNPVGGTRYVIKAPNKYSHIRYSGIELNYCSASDYLEIEGGLLRFILSLIASIQEKECTIIRYEPKWIVRKSESPKLSALLHKNGIDNGVQGITVSKNDTIIGEFVISALRYNSFIQFLFLGKRVVITPTDHLDVFIDLPESNAPAKKIEMEMKDFKTKGRFFFPDETKKGDDIPPNDEIGE